MAQNFRCKNVHMECSHATCQEITCSMNFTTMLTESLNLTVLFARLIHFTSLQPFVFADDVIFTPQFTPLCPKWYFWFKFFSKYFMNIFQLTSEIPQKHLNLTKFYSRTSVVVWIWNTLIVVLVLIRQANQTVIPKLFIVIRYSQHNN